MGLLLVLVAVGLVRWRFLDMPLERDEGEFAYAGQRILAGDELYRSVYVMKLPGIYWAYALIESLLGQTARAIHQGLLIVNLVNIVLVYALGSKLLDAPSGLLAAIGFALLTLSPISVQGMNAQAEHFVLVPALVGMLFLSHASERGSLPAYFVGGLSFGIALLLKQHGGAFALMAVIVAAIATGPANRGGWKSRLGRIATVGIGIMTPLGIACGMFLTRGNFEDFRFWAVTYAGEYVSMVPLSMQPRMAALGLRGQLAASASIWGAAAVGVAMLWWDSPPRNCRGFLLLLLGASIASLLPGGYFRSHYFVLMAPALALLAAAGLRSLAALYRQQGGGPWLPLVLPAIVFGWPTVQLWALLGPVTPDQLFRQVYDVSPFLDARVVGQYLAEHTSPDESIGVLGSEPEIPFYAKRRSASGHIYMYPLLEPHPYAEWMRGKLIEEIEAAKPRFIVYCGYRTSWINVTLGRPKAFDQWMHDYLTEHYDPVGVVESPAGGESVSIWGEGAADYRAGSDSWMVVHRRRD